MSDTIDPNSNRPLLSGEVTREPLHTRRIELEGYRRSDGLYEVEARLTDRKPFEFQPPSRDEPVAANAAIHDHLLRVVFGEDMVIRAVETTMQAFPYRQCPPGGDILQAMVGARIGPGWAGELRRRLPSGETCTHFRELMVVVATAAYQSTVSLRTRRKDDVDTSGRPRKIDSCYAYGESRELVQRLWPAFHRAAPEDASGPR